MTKSFLAVIQSDGHGKVIPVGFAQVPPIVATEQSAGSTVIGEYNAHHIAERAVRLAQRGWRRPEERKQQA
jgi:hypothetical protein